MRRILPAKQPNSAKNAN